MPFEKMTPADIFKCQQCGDCCRGYGGTFVTPADIAAIAAYIRTDPDRFVQDYCQMSGSRPVLAQGDDGYCIFWEKVCTIHPVKPRMCRQWPFIEAVLADVGNWYVMAAGCPGIRTDIPGRIVCDCTRKALAEMGTEDKSGHRGERHPWNGPGPVAG